MKAYWNILSSGRTPKEWNKIKIEYTIHYNIVNVDYSNNPKRVDPTAIFGFIKNFMFFISIYVQIIGINEILHSWNGNKINPKTIRLPQFDYLDTIYNKAGITKLKELDILYKKIAKIVLDVPITENSLNVYKDMKWLPLHLRRQVHLASYMHRIINNNCPTNTYNKFVYVSGGSRSGNNCDLYINKSKTHKDFKYLGAKCWNMLPTYLRISENTKLFSTIYKNKLLESITVNSLYNTNNAYDFFYKLE